MTSWYLKYPGSINDIFSYYNTSGSAMTDTLLYHETGTCGTGGTWNYGTGGTWNYGTGGTWNYGTGGSLSSDIWNGTFTVKYNCKVSPCIIGDHWYFIKQTTRLSNIIQLRMSPAIHLNNRRRAIRTALDEREIRARETLARVLGSDKYRAFLKNGFVSVIGKSGLTYQIFPGSGITCVFKQGKLVERLCVVLIGGFPPTDSLIMRYLMILNDEKSFRSKAIKHSIATSEITHFQHETANQQPLALAL